MLNSKHTKKLSFSLFRLFLPPLLFNHHSTFLSSEPQLCRTIHIYVYKNMLRNVLFDLKKKAMKIGKCVLKLCHDEGLETFVCIKI